MEKNFMVILVGVPFLYQNGDHEFAVQMARVGLKRGSCVLSGLKHKIIVANRYEYFLTDCDSVEEFANSYKAATVTYDPGSFIEEIYKQLDMQQYEESLF